MKFGVMMYDGRELISGKETMLLEDYVPDEGSPGYEIIQVEADSLQDVIVCDDGQLYQADNLLEDFVVGWTPITHDQARERGLI